MESSHPGEPAQSVLDQSLLVMQPLVRWLLRSGIGYNEFTSALKTVFLQETESELQRTQGKRNDSTRSLLSGLHRKDIRTLLPLVLAATAAGQPRADALNSRPSLASKVVTRWLALEWPVCLPMTGDAPSFEALAREVSVDVHPRAVLLELIRLGIARENALGVWLERAAFVPNPGQHEAQQMVAASVADHLAAGVANVTSERAGSFLEQSVFAEGLRPDSVQALERLAADLWPKVMKTLVKEASRLYAQDADHGGDQRFRLGMFSYSAPLASPPPPGTEGADAA